MLLDCLNSKKNGTSRNKKKFLSRCPFVLGQWQEQITVTDSPNSCATPLFRHPQGSQGYLEKQNHPLSLNLVVWCAKIWPKTKKLRKTVEKPSLLTFFFVNSEVFQTFFVLGPILANQTTKFILSVRFCFSRHPWRVWRRLNSGVTQKLAESVTVLKFTQVENFECLHYLAKL